MVTGSRCAALYSGNDNDCCAAKTYREECVCGRQSSLFPGGNQRICDAGTIGK